MYCIYCGEQIEKGTKFCPYCGRRQRVESPSSSHIGSYIDNVGEQIGDQIDDAVREVSDEVRNFGDKVTDNVSRASDRVEDLQKNWRDYLTPRNMEYAAAVSLLLPMFMDITAFVIGMLGTVFYAIPLIGWVVVILLPHLVRFIFIAAVCAGAAAIAYLLVKYPERRTTSAYITAGASALAVLACIGFVSGWGSISTVFAVIAFVWGLDVISRVVLQDLPIHSAPDIANDFGYYGAWYAEYKAAHPSGKEYEAQRIESDPYCSYFDGNGGTLFGLIFLTGIVSLITCGIGTPWMLCKIYRWRKEHTVIDGKRLAFTGTGGSLIGHWILWTLLTAVTCGIYGFFMAVALKRWEMQNTVYADEPYQKGAFDGNSFQYFGYSLLEGLLIGITCGLGFPWAEVMMEKWATHHCLVGPDRLRFEGTALGLLGQYLIVFVLTLITCGIYAPWGIVRMNKFMCANTHVDWR